MNIFRYSGWSSLLVLSICTLQLLKVEWQHCSQYPEVFPGWSRDCLTAIKPHYHVIDCKHFSDISCLLFIS